METGDMIVIHGREAHRQGNVSQTSSGHFGDERRRDLARLAEVDQGLVAFLRQPVEPFRRRAGFPRRAWARPRRTAAGPARRVTSAGTGGRPGVGARPRPSGGLRSAERRPRRGRRRSRPRSGSRNGPRRGEVERRQVVEQAQLARPGLERPRFGRGRPRRDRREATATLRRPGGRRRGPLGVGPRQAVAAVAADLVTRPGGLVVGLARRGRARAPASPPRRCCCSRPVPGPPTGAGRAAGSTSVGAGRAAPGRHDRGRGDDGRGPLDDRHVGDDRPAAAAAAAAEAGAGPPRRRPARGGRGADCWQHGPHGPKNPDWQPVCDRMTRVSTGSRNGCRRSFRRIDGVPRADRPPRSQGNLIISGTPLSRHPNSRRGPQTGFVRLAIAAGRRRIATVRGDRRDARGQPSRGRRRFDPHGRARMPEAGGSGRRFASGRSWVSTQIVGNRSLTRRGACSPPAVRHRSGGTRPARSLARPAVAPACTVSTGKTARDGCVIRVTTLGMSIVAET